VFPAQPDDKRLRWIKTQAAGA